MAGGRAVGEGGGLACEGKCIDVLFISTSCLSWSSSRNWLSSRCVRASGLCAPSEQGYAGQGSGGGERRDGARWGSWRAWGARVDRRGLEARLGGGAGEGEALGACELIFKISHTKSRRKVQNLDPRSDVARPHLQMARWVYEGGESREGRQGGGQSGGEVWRLLRESAPSPPGRRPGADPRPPPAPPPHPPPAPNGGPAGPTRAVGPPRSADGPCLPLGRGLGGGAIELGAVFGRESIFKISHTKSQQKVQNLDPRSDVARRCLHLARRVNEGGRASTKGQWADGAWGGCPGNPWAPLQAQRELLTYPSNSYRAALEQLPTVCRRFCR